MLGNYAIGSLIRESRIHEISSVLEVSSQQGMHTLDQDLERLAKDGLVTIENTLMNANRPDILRGKLFSALKTKGTKDAAHAGRRV
jgi:twitching motility protein PilT